MPRSAAADTGLGALLALLVLSVNVLSVSSRLGFVHKAKQVKEYDHWRYIHMARGDGGRPALQQEPPYCYRLAVPAAVRGLARVGIPVDVGFYVLTNAALFGFLLLLWLHLRDLGFPAPLRATGLLVVGFTQGAVRWFEYQYWMTDPGGLLLTMLAVFLIERRRPIALGVTSVLAATVRETYVVVYPYYALHLLRRGLPAWAAAWRAAAVALPALAVLVAIRLLVTPNQPDGFVPGIVDSLGFRWRHVLDNQLYVLTVGSFGVLFPLALLFPRRLPALLRRHYDRAFFVLSVYASLAISNNTERPLAYALPVLVPAALWALRTFLEESRLPAGPVLVAVVFLQALFWWNHRWAQMGMSIYQPVNWVTAVAMATAWLIAQVALARGRRPEVESS